MNTVEDAYRSIAEVLVNSVEGVWDAITFSTLVLGKNCSSMMTSRLVGDCRESIGLGFSNGFKANDAALYLRDNLFKTTGQRIWGLTFTLYPEGKFHIEYDYNKPADYEESDETISLDEALGGLSDLSAKIDKD
jgi:hypothetical protein